LTGITFDAGGLIALERNDRRVLALVRVALDGDSRIAIPATILAQVIRNPARQVRLSRLIQHDKTEVVPLDTSHAQAVGLLLAKSGTSDIADAHVVICAQRTGHAVITSDPFDLRRLDPRLSVIPI
jgi:predicted nucleic acid-binding protein